MKNSYMYVCMYVWSHNDLRRWATKIHLVIYQFRLFHHIHDCPLLKKRLGDLHTKKTQTKTTEIKLNAGIHL